jgi:hypothetical protein
MQDTLPLPPVADPIAVLEWIDRAEVPTPALANHAATRPGQCLPETRFQCRAIESRPRDRCFAAIAELPSALLSGELSMEGRLDRITALTDPQPTTTSAGSTPGRAASAATSGGAP